MSAVTTTPIPPHHISVDPSIIVQSSLALVMAITMTDAVKATVEHAGTIYPGNGLYHKFIAVIVVVVLIMAFSIYVSKHRRPAVKTSPTATRVQNSVASAGVDIANPAVAAA